MSSIIQLPLYHYHLYHLLLYHYVYITITYIIYYYIINVTDSKFVTDHLTSTADHRPFTERSPLRYTTLEFGDDD